jgi:hypothetical protein
LAVVLLVGSITTTMLFYRDKAAPGTSLAGVLVSGQTEAQLVKTIDNLTKAIRLKITYEDKTVEASAGDLGIKIDSATTARTAVQTGQQNILGLLFSHAKIKLVAKYERQTARDFISQNFTELTADPIDAQVVFDASQVKFGFQAGATGKSIDVQNLDAMVLSLIDKPRAATLNIQTNDATPIISNAAAEKSAEAANVRLALAIRIINSGRVIWTIDPPDIANWTNFTANPSTGRYDITFDKNKIVDFINNRVAGQVSDKPINQIAITDVSGNIFRLVSPGKNGQVPNNVDQLAGQIVVALNNAVAEDFELTTSEAPYQTDGTVALNNHWIEADLSDYSVMLYEGTNLVWQTNQTAHGKPSTPTITGLFKVFSKVYQQCMPNPPSPDPLCNIHYVTYWGPGGYAFHEAWWMQSYQIGTGISHGCVNMRQADAKTVYDFSSIGTPVWVHG